MSFHHTSSLVANQVSALNRLNSNIIENDISEGYLTAKQISN